MVTVTESVWVYEHTTAVKCGMESSDSHGCAGCWPQADGDMTLRECCRCHESCANLMVSVELPERSRV